MPDYAAIHAQFRPLYEDMQAPDSYPTKRPLLAHYTSIETLERILATNQIWFSNPLFMSDLEEVRFGINEGYRLFQGSDSVRKACGTAARGEILHRAFDEFFNAFANEHVLDLYVLCLSEHKPENADGLLSMWRGYGGNGKGVALVFDTAKFGENPASPLVLSHVRYKSADGTRVALGRIIEHFAELLSKANVPDDGLRVAAWAAFERIKAFAVFTKHSGFFEEQEWRIAYLKELDVGKKLESAVGYALGKRGVEPKLKLELRGIEGVTPADLSLSHITKQIILGPSVSSPLARAAVLRMLDKLGRPELKERVTASTIPFRAD